MELQTNKGIEYVWIQGQWKAELLYRCKEYVKCIPVDDFQQALENNPNAMQTDFIKTFTPSLIEKYERTKERR